MSVPSWYPPRWAKLLVWLGAGVLGWLVVVAVVVAVVVLAGGCAEGTAGEVCTEPNAADCDSHTGGELAPKAGMWAGFGYGLNATPADDVGRNWEAEK